MRKVKGGRALLWFSWRVASRWETECVVSERRMRRMITEMQKRKRRRGSRFFFGWVNAIVAMERSHTQQVRFPLN